jgi:sugar/nucleoside kinase (ribokinase family)
MSNYSYRVAVMGHLAVDVTADVSDTELKLDRGDFSDFDRKIRNRSGGTALVLADAAQALGCSIAVIGKVGADTFGNIIIEDLRNRGMTTLVTTADAAPTGTVIIVYLSNDRRILLGDRGANAYLSLDDIDAVAEQISSSDTLFVSGYVFLDASARAAAIRAMEIARDAGVFVAFDIVPHTIYRVFSFSDFVQLTVCSDAVTLGLNTARRFLGFDDRIHQQHSSSEVNEIVGALLKYYQFVILNLSNDIQLIADRRSKMPWRTVETGYAYASDRVGYLDRVFVRSVCEYLDRSKGHEHGNG